jgi:non-homologous end joining protein Ku
MIDAKIKGKNIVAPEAEEATPATINLVDALLKSLSKSRRATKSVDLPRKTIDKTVTSENNPETG